MAWDKTKPVAGPNSAAVSADHRANWAAIETALGGVNLLADPTFLIWPAGDAAAPAHWVLGGAGAAVARTGTGLGDTNRKVGLYAAKATSGGGAAGTLLQRLLTTTSYDDSFDGLVVTLGAWVRATVAGTGRLTIQDGATTSFSSYHTGGSTWEWLTVTHTINAAATELKAGLEVLAGGQAAHISGPTFLAGQVPPAQFQPAPVVILRDTRFIAGTQTVGARKSGGELYFSRPTLIKAVSLAVLTAPTGAALIVDVNHYDGAALQSLFATRPQIAAASSTSVMTVPDGTYRHRCFAAAADGSATDKLGTIDVDQIGSGDAGTDLYIILTYLQYGRPLEAFLGVTEVN